jgi:Uma2 family endonuclease
MAAEARIELISVEEFLELERASDVKHEYVDGELFAFAGASKRHIDIVLNIVEVLRPVARAHGCRTYANDLMVRVDPTRIYYPDVVIVCSEDGDDDYVTTRPCLIVEVLSPSTSGTDQREKLQAYRQVDGLAEYLIVEQRFPSVERHWTNDGKTWWRAAYTADSVPIACTDHELPVSAIYRDIAFE